MLKLVSLLALVGCAVAATLVAHGGLSVDTLLSSSALNTDFGVEENIATGKASYEILPATDMPSGNVLNFAIQEAVYVVDYGYSDDRAAESLSAAFKRTFVPSPASAQWGAIVGNAFGAIVPRAVGRTFHARVGGRTIIIYQTPQ